MLTNRRIHLSSKDGNGGNPTNMADVSFDLTKARIKVETPLNLNLGLIKSMISSDISLMGTSETNPVFSLIIGQPPAPPLTSNPYYFYFTETKYEFPYGVGNPDSVYIPISHIDTVETFIGIINETINDSLKKKGRLSLSAPFFLSSTLFILRISTFLNYLV